MKSIILSSLFVAALAISAPTKTSRSSQSVVKTADNCWFDENGAEVCEPPDPWNDCSTNPDLCQ